MTHASSFLGEDDAMILVLGFVLKYMPLIFGVGFVSPLITQVIERAGWTLPYGVPPLVFGLAAGLLLGLRAQFRGRWI
jgi:hypothetical protein